MAAMEAASAAETKRLITEGHCAILKVGHSRDDSAEAFQQFRRGVTRADGHEIGLLHELSEKPKVLSFLVDFAQNRRSHRRQVGSVLCILLKDSAWQEAAKEFSSMAHQLPEDMSFVQAALLGKSLEEGYTTSSRKEASAATMSVLSSFAELKESNFDCRVAADALSRFAQGVVLVAQWQQEELKSIASLEPKLPMLRLLCEASQSLPYQQEQLRRLLEELLQNPDLDSWRIAAQGDFHISTYLGNLHLVDSDHSPESEDHAYGPEEELYHQTQLKARWMWQDAGRYGGIIGVGLAKLNPTRWSQVLRVEDTIADLEQYLDLEQYRHRPVRIEVSCPGRGRQRVEASSVAEAVQKLFETKEELKDEA